MTQPKAGEAVDLGQGIRRILAPNPSPMTYWGTNTYLVGDDEVIVIDPGPDDPAHYAAIMTALGCSTLTHICVTHSHLDHSPLARVLSEKTGAPVYAFGASAAGRSPVMQHLAQSGLAGGGEGVDAAFRPDVTVADGDTIGPLRALHTPGHMGNHLAFALGDTVFTGDLVMGWASSLVSPPDGDLDDFLGSCARLRDMDAKRLLPGHGEFIDAPRERLNWLIDHRNARTAEILETLKQGAMTAPQIAEIMYADVSPSLLPAATRNVVAHLVSLAQKGRVTAAPTLSADAIFARTDDRA